VKRLLAPFVALLVLLALGAAGLEAILEIREARRVYREARRRFHPFLQILPSGDSLDGVNPDRFRGEPVPPAKASGTLRIFTLGGSTTLGVRNTFEESYPRLLEGRLRKQFPSMRIEVENAGVDWYTTAHSLVNYQLRVRRFQPDLVIVMHAINDLTRSFAPPWFATGPYAPDYSHYLGPQIALLGPQTGFQAGYERGDWILWRRLRQAIRRDPWPLDLTPDGVARLRSRLTETTVDSFKSLDSFTANYDLLVRAIQGDGHVVIAASEPSLYKETLSADEARVVWFPPVFCAEDGVYPSITSMVSGMRQFNDAARSVAQARGVPFLDFANAVPKSLTYFQDDVHLTRAGNDMLAHMAALWIINNPVPPMPAPPGIEPGPPHGHHR
jgi:lysophospholipase L1-like esterase